jgi:peptidoglycan/LPS O-acetylase OafA/YrhL
LTLRLKDWHIPAYVNDLPNQAGEQPWQSQYTLLCFAAALVLAAAITYLFEKPLAKKMLR